MDTITPDTTTPRIYVACLASYNNGILHGAWIPVNPNAWDIWDGIAAMLAASPTAGAEEYAIHDHEGFEGIDIDEDEDVDHVGELAVYLTEHGPLGADIYNYAGGDLEASRRMMSCGYLGCYTNLAEYMQEMIEEEDSIPESLRPYIDWQAMARDAEMSGDLFTIESGFEEVHVFAGR